jgi:hypothetical protein
MAAAAFTPPSLDQHEGPADGFTPPPLDSHEGVAGNPIERFAKNFWDQVNPLALGNAMIEAAKHPLDTLDAAGKAMAKPLYDGIKAVHEGNYTEAARHFVNYGLNASPGVGSTLDAAGNQMEQGDIAGGAGKTAGLATAMLAPKIVPKIVEGVDTAVRATGRAVSKGVDALSGVDPELIGVVSPRAAHGLRVMQKLKKVLGSEGATAETAAPAAESAPIPPKIIPGEAEAGAARPEWRQSMVDELNKPTENATVQELAAPPIKKVVPRGTPKVVPINENAGNLGNLGNLGNDAPAHPFEAVNRDKLALDLAKWLHREGKGIPLEDAQRMTPANWKMARDAVRPGMTPATPSPTTVKAALTHLERLESQRSIAEQMAEEVAR